MKTSNVKNTAVPQSVSQKTEPSELVEVVRSFAAKINIGNYESRDFFCSRKRECFYEDVDDVSEELHRLCMDDVQRSIDQYQRSRTAGHPPLQRQPLKRTPPKPIQDFNDDDVLF